MKKILLLYILVIPFWGHANISDTTFHHRQLSFSFLSGYAQRTVITKITGNSTLKGLFNLHFQAGAEEHFFKTPSFYYSTGFKINIWTLNYLDDVPKTSANHYLFDEYDYNQEFTDKSIFLFGGIGKRKDFGKKFFYEYSGCVGLDIHQKRIGLVRSYQSDTLGSPNLVPVLYIIISNKDGLRFIRFQGFVSGDIGYKFHNGSNIKIGLAVSWGPGFMNLGSYSISPGTTEESQGNIDLKSGYAGLQLTYSFRSKMKMKQL